MLTDGYWNSRIIQYTAEGKHVMEWGALGDGPGEFDLLQGLAVDEDRVYVGDRQNHRIQLFTHDCCCLRSSLQAISRGQKASWRRS